MPFSDKGTRKLPFPLTSALEPVADTPNETISYGIVTGFPDETTRVNITLNLSLDEYVALATAIDVGRDIAFAEDSELIWWTWVRAFTEGNPSMSCADVADCVESEIVANNTDLINILTQNSISNGFSNTNHVNGDITTVLDRNAPLSLDEPIVPEFECNLDKLWAGIRHGIVARLDDTARDMLEDLAAINDLPQRFQAFIDVIPVIGDIAEAVVEVTTEVIPDILNLYNSHSSEAVLDEIACDLFAMVCNQCEYPTFKQVYDYYSTLGYEMNSMEAQTLAPMVQKLGAMISAFQPASVVYHTMITFQLFTLYLNAVWNGNAGKETVFKFATLGEDYANDNWLQLCDTCDQAYMEFIFDFTQQSYSSYRTGNFSGSIMSGDYIAGVGWRVSAINTTDGLMQVGLPMLPEWQVKAVAIQTTAADGGTPNFWRTRIQSNSGAGTVTGNMNAADAPYAKRQNFANPITGFKEYAIRMPGSLESGLTLEKIAMKFVAGSAPLGSTPVASGTYDPV